MSAEGKPIEILPFSSKPFWLWHLRVMDGREEWAESACISCHLGQNLPPNGYRVYGTCE